MTAYSQEHLKALNHAYSFFSRRQGRGGGGGEGGSTECIMENSKMIKFLKNFFFFIFRGELAYIHVVTFVKSCKKVRISFIFSLLLYSNHL